MHLSQGMSIFEEAAKQAPAPLDVPRIVIRIVRDPVHGYTVTDNGCEFEDDDFDHGEDCSTAEALRMAEDEARRRRSHYADEGQPARIEGP
jgi:hypothetical protein